MGQKSSKPSQPPSKLERYISKGQWEDVMFYLKSPEGNNEVNQGGLISYQGKSRLITQPLWTAIFHRAPIDVVKKIYNLRIKLTPNLEESEASDLLHVALESSNGPKDIRREYSSEECMELIKFLSEHICLPKSFLHKANSLPGTKNQRQCTPLGHAVSNPKVSASIVRYLCFKCPDAIEIDCIFIDDDYEYDISVLALSLGQEHKRDLIVRGSDFYRILDDETKKTIEKDYYSALALPLPDDSVIGKAVRAAAGREEWHVVNDILPLLSSNSNELSWVIDIRENMEKHYSKKRQAAEKNDKLRKYAGLVMLEIDIISDLLSTAIPKRKRKRRNVPLAS